jgi:acyl carrier protein
MAARLGLRQRHAQLGLNAIPPTLGLQALGAMLRQDAPQVGVLAMDWRRWRQSTASGGQSPLLAALDGPTGEDPSSPAQPEAEADLAQRLLLLEDPAARRALMEDAILAGVARVLGLDRSQLDPRQPLNLLGVDSLMAVELKTHLETGLGLSISVVDLLRGLSAADLAEGAVAQLTAGDADLARALEEIEELSLEEVQQLLG